MQKAMWAEVLIELTNETLLISAILCRH